MIVVVVAIVVVGGGGGAVVVAIFCLVDSCDCFVLIFLSPFIFSFMLLLLLLFFHIAIGVRRKKKDASPYVEPHPNLLNFTLTNLESSPCSKHHSAIY